MMNEAMKMRIRKEIDNYFKIWLTICMNTSSQYTEAATYTEMKLGGMLLTAHMCEAITDEEWDEISDCLMSYDWVDTYNDLTA